MKPTRRNHTAVFKAKVTFPMRSEFICLVALVGWATRKVLAHRVSISMTTDFCVDALTEAIEKYGVNNDRRSKFTSNDFTQVLKDNNIKISMDGKGYWVDNVLVERLRKSVKYEHVYLHAYETVARARKLGGHLKFFNCRRPHSSLDRQTPNMVYFRTQSQLQAA